MVGGLKNPAIYKKDADNFVSADPHYPRGGSDAQRLMLTNKATAKEPDGSKWWRWLYLIFCARAGVKPNKAATVDPRDIIPDIRTPPPETTRIERNVWVDGYVGPDAGTE